MATVTDTFTRADNALTLGTSDSGHTYTVLAVRAGTKWGIKSNGAYTPTNDPVPEAAAVVDIGAADAAVEFDITIMPVFGAAPGWGACFRAVNATNLWYFFDQYLFKVVSGTFTQVYNHGSAPCAAGDRVRIEVRGTDSFKLYTNGSLIIDIAPDLSAHATATMHGMYMAWAAVEGRYDNLLIEPLTTQRLYAGRVVI